MKRIAWVIGAGRSGTTSLCHYLAMHPDIAFSSIKEVHYYSLEDQYHRGQKYLDGFFAGNGQRVSSDTYLLTSRTAPQRMRHDQPQTKLIVLLRDPVERAYSSYRYAIHNGYHTDDIAFQDLEQYETHYTESNDPVEVDNHGHLWGSHYKMHLERWLQYFPKEQLLILTTKELSANPEGLLRRVTDFLEIAPFTSVPALPPQHAASGSRFKPLQQFLVNRNHPARRILRLFLRPFTHVIIRSGGVDRLKQWNRKEAIVPPLDGATYEDMQNLFTEDLRWLKETFGVTL